MYLTPDAAHLRGLRRPNLPPYLGIAALLILFPDQLQAVFGELSYTNPLFILAVYGPAIAAENGGAKLDHGSGGEVLLRAA